MGFLINKPINCTVLPITMVFCSRIEQNLKQKDLSYKYAKDLIAGGSITSLNQAFKVVKLRQIARDTNLKYATLQNRTNNPEKYRLEEFIEIARIFDLTANQVMDLALNDMKPVSRKQKS